MQGDTYTNGTTFDEVICLYMIDSEIKQAFSKQYSQQNYI